ncbi:hypothetical protein P3T73_04735 [Kiritimatiellota bacterium B12222]|nr:hypothetical protein P3T73_04735 [Kiritimatiellota bacterium B12222]
MHILVRFSLIVLAGICIRTSAGQFSKQVPADSFLYMETRDFPGYLQRINETPAFNAIKDLGWKNLILQLYQIGLESDDTIDLDEDTPSLEDVNAFIDGAEKNWKNITDHLSGDVAVSVGNFQDVLKVFQVNGKIRKTLQLTYGNDNEFLTDEELTEEELENRIKRQAEEDLLDLQELNSILGQFRFWADIKDAPALEKQIETWLTELMDEEEEDDIQIEKKDLNGVTLYRIISEENEDAPSLNWAIQQDVLVVSLSRTGLLDALQNLSTPLKASLANRQAFQEASTFMGNTDHLLYFNFAPLEPLLLEIAETASAQNNDASIFGKLPEPKKVIEWLAFDAMLPYVIGSQLDPEGFRIRGRYGFNRECAISRIIIDPNEEPAILPPFVHQNFSKLSCFNWNLGEGWSRLETEMMGIAPQAAAAMGLGRMLASGQVGFDLKLQFLDQLNGKCVFVQTFDPEVIEKMIQATEEGDLSQIMQVQMEHPTGGQNYLLAFGMKDEAQIQDAFERLGNRFHPNGEIESVLFEEQELFYPIPDNLQGGKFKNIISYTYLDGYIILAIGDDELLKQAVHASKDASLRMAHTPDYQSIRQKLLPHATAIEYVSAEQQNASIQVMQATLGMFQNENEDLELPDFSPLFNLIKQSMSVSVRKDLVFEIDGLIEFTVPEE